MALRSTKTGNLQERDYGQAIPGVNYADGPEADPLYLNKTRHISSVLQTTLDVNKVVELFIDEIRSSIAHDSATFQNERHGIEINLGEPARHSCSYRLVVNGESLGELRLTRKKRFSNAETALLERLLTALVYPLRNALMYSEALRAAFLDPLTGVNNRTTLGVALKREIELARRHGTPLSLIILDIDHFKVINDTYGHATGDRVIKALAECVTDSIRRTDILFRYGGEEFTLLLSNTAQEGALLLAERVRRKAEKIVCEQHGARISVTVSLGVACLGEHDDEKQLFEKADSALYCAKYEGRNRVKIAA